MSGKKTKKSLEKERELQIGRGKNKAIIDHGRAINKERNSERKAVQPKPKKGKK